MKKIELLAPAKNLEYGIMAIKCGADAVYIGADKFGARNLASNSLEDLKLLVDFAHRYFAKVYVTINTVLNDDEIAEAEELINMLYKIGIDAIIVQDMGILELNLPPIPLFASTQTHNTSAEKVRFLEKVGFKRVILARELSLARIQEIKSNTDVDLESFIHGSLCVSYSGQCYMSYAIGGRSGNRGECAQPCRKSYSLIDEAGKAIVKNKYLLSLKDLNLSNSIEEMIDAGITSFKIEGRLKDINYIKNVVSFYRQEIDKTLERKGLVKSSSGKSYTNFTSCLDKTFNRGYCEYFINERKQKIASVDSPKWIGEPIGKIKSVEQDFFELDNELKINKRDGISFFDENGNLTGTAINKAEDRKIYPNSISSIKPGLNIFRNLDYEFIKSIKSSSIERKIIVNFDLSQKDNGLILKAIDEDLNEAEISIIIPHEIARDKHLAINNIKKQFSKLGDTEFELSELEINTTNVYFIPVSVLNDMRRRVIDTLTETRKANYKRDFYSIKRNEFPYPEKSLDYRGNVLNTHAYNFYKRHGVEMIEPAAESGFKMNNKAVMTTKYCLKHQYGMCEKFCEKQKSIKLYLVDEKNKKYKLNFDCKECEMNIIF